MSVVKIEYPSLHATRVAATVTHGEIVEKDLDDSVVFFKATRNEAGLNMELVSVWFKDKNFGTVYSSSTPRKDK